MPGVAIIDNNCFDDLEDPASRRTFLGHLRAADWVPQITEVNVLEAIAITSAAKRDRIVAVVRDLAASILILPWPLEMLAQLGHAMIDGKTSHWVVASSADSFLHNRDDALRIQEETREFNRMIERSYSEQHDLHRVDIHGRMRNKRLRDPYRDVEHFLHEYWYPSKTRADFANVMWRGLKLAGEAPMEVIDQCEPWRLFVDAEGVALYERAIATNQPKRIQRMDLMQLTYLGVAPKRVIITADAGLIRAANAILPGRYHLAAAAHISRFI
jgi:hypothetical protein